MDQTCTTPVIVTLQNIAVGLSGKTDSSSLSSIVSDTRAYQGEFKMAQAVNSCVAMNFSGQKFSIIYRTCPVSGKMPIYLDGKLIFTLNQHTSTALYQQKWRYGGTLTAVSHKLKLVFVVPSGGKASLDAVSIP